MNTVLKKSLLASICSFPTTVISDPTVDFDWIVLPAEITIIGIGSEKTEFENKIKLKNIINLNIILHFLS